MRTSLQVPFAEKDQAKQLGARWDAARKVWFVENKPDMAPFARWMPANSLASAPDQSGQGGSATSRQQASGKFFVGSAYVERPRVCACLPWSVCETCQSTALS
jgi:hypothetical protein